MVGDNPTRPRLASAVNRLAAIFQKLQKPPTRPVNGLFGELFVLCEAEMPCAPLMLGVSTI
jgi:hypothetical protein